MVDVSIVMFGSPVVLLVASRVVLIVDALVVLAVDLLDDKVLTLVKGRVADEVMREELTEAEREVVPSDRKLVVVRSEEKACEETDVVSLGVVLTNGVDVEVRRGPNVGPRGGDVITSSPAQ